MGYVPKSPAAGRSYDSDRRAMQADISRIDRERNDGRPGSVVSSDDARLVIPGPLADAGRDGQVLTWDEDLHQPRWAAGGGGAGGFTRAKPGTTTVTSGGISFSGWTFDSTYDVSPFGKPSLVTSGGETFDVAGAGMYFQRTNFFAHINVATSIDLFINNANIDSVDPASYQSNLSVPAGTPTGGRYAYLATLWHGPFWLPGSAASGSGLAPLRVQVGWSGRGTSPSTAFVSVEVDIVRGA